MADTIKLVLEGVYARAADNNGNSDYLKEGYPDYSVDEALAEIKRIIEQSAEEWALQGRTDEHKYALQNFITGSFLRALGE